MCGVPARSPFARVCPLESAVRCEHVMLMEMRGPGRVSWTLWSVVRYRQGVWSEYGKAVSREEAVLYRMDCNSLSLDLEYAALWAPLPLKP